MPSLLEQNPQLLSHWYAVGLSHRLRIGRSERQTFFGQPVVIFRNPDGSPGALTDRCPHRSVPLSDGQIRAEGGIRCAYHGWEFDRQGACVKVPGLCSGRRLPTAIVPGFPLCERGGIIWLSPAPSEPGAPPALADLPDPKRFSSFFMTAAGSSKLVDALENLLDPMHTHFVHRGLIRSEGMRQRVRVTVRRGTDRVEASYEGESRPSGFLSRWWQGRDPVSVGRFVLPATGELEYRNHRGVVFIMRVHFTPGAEDRLQITVAVSVRRFPLVPAFGVAAVLRLLLRAALRQDQRVLSRQSYNARSFPDAPTACTELDVLRPHIELLMRDGSAQPLQRNIEMEL